VLRTALNTLRNLETDKEGDNDKEEKFPDSLYFNVMSQAIKFLEDIACNAKDADAVVLCLEIMLVLALHRRRQGPVLRWIACCLRLNNDEVELDCQMLSEAAGKIGVKAAWRWLTLDGQRCSPKRAASHLMEVLAENSNAFAYTNMEVRTKQSRLGLGVKETGENIAAKREAAFCENPGGKTTYRIQNGDVTLVEDLEGALNVVCGKEDAGAAVFRNGQLQALKASSVLDDENVFGPSAVESLNKCTNGLLKGLRSSILGGDCHAAAFSVIGAAWLWGEGSRGQLGIKEVTFVETPTEIDRCMADFVGDMSLGDGFTVYCNKPPFKGGMRNVGGSFKQSLNYVDFEMKVEDMNY